MKFVCLKQDGLLSEAIRTMGRDLREKKKNKKQAKRKQDARDL